MSPQREPSLESQLRAQVACCGQTHTIVMHDGHIALLDHGPAELERERVLRSMGAPPMACEAVVAAWRRGDVDALPAAWAQLRSTLQRAVDFNDTAVLLELLDAGVDCTTQTVDGRSLLHLLYRFEPPVVERLLDAADDLEVRDREGRTPMRVAIDHGAAEVVDALCARGADVATVGPYAEPGLLLVAQRVWSREVDPEGGISIMHGLLDHDPGPYDVRAIAFRCALAEQPTADLAVAAGDQRFAAGPSDETVDATVNYLATRLFEVAVRAEDEHLIRRLAEAGFVSWATDDHTFSPSDAALRQLVLSVVDEGAR